MATVLIFSSLLSENVLGAKLQDAKQAFAEERFEEARDTYRSLAETKDGNKAARYRLAEGLAAYEGQDYRGARQAFSGALISEEDIIVAEAHEGMGNTLFQLGWMGLAGSRYPIGEEAPDLEKFDSLVKEQLSRMSEAEVPESGETNEFIRIDSIILNWADAIRHYRSAKKKNPADQGPVQNEVLTETYLVRLAELLEKEKEQAEQEMPQPGEGQPQQGEGEGEPQEGEGEGEPQEGEGSGEESEEGEGSNGEEEERDGEGEGENENEDKGEEGENEPVDPNESPEDRARRLLKENSDLEKGPMSPGRRDFRSPEKDY